LGKVRNNEEQFYTLARRENVRLERGNLVIEARQEPWSHAPVTSASLTSRPAWKYGYFEVRAKVPTGRGTWPAIWTLGDAFRRKGEANIPWPLSGEIDMMEYVGFDPEKVHFNVHTFDAHNGKPEITIPDSKRSSSIAVPRVWEGFHTYGLDWNRDRLEFYFDGKKVMTYRNDGKGKNSWPFDDPQYLLLNLAIGGAWGGQQGVDPKIFPAKFLVDYVRIYQP